MLAQRKHWLDWTEEMRMLAARQLAETLRILSHASNKFDCRKIRKLTEGVNAPEMKCLRLCG